jgi:hypothetical protein
MEDKRICSICKIEKSIDSYYRCKGCKGGRNSICKLCKQKGLKVNKDHIVHPFNQMWRQPEEKFFSLNGVKKEDYVLMWELLKNMGYDIDKDIHQQFLDKHNKTRIKPMKYKKRAMKDKSQWFADGEKNPDKTVNIPNKKPPFRMNRGKGN